MMVRLFDYCRNKTIKRHFNQREGTAYNAFSFCQDYEINIYMQDIRNLKTAPAFVLKVASTTSITVF